jgi:hypothetical protein
VWPCRRDDGRQCAVAHAVAHAVAQNANGTVRFAFASRPEVCGNGRGNVSVRGATRSGRGRDEWEDECEAGPVRVALDLADGHVIEVRMYVDGRWKQSSSTRDLGIVGVKEATDYLLHLAETADGRVGEQAILPATIADSVTVWPRLLAIAKNGALAQATRKQAVFWVSQAAGAKATEGLKELVGDAAADRDVREQAVFALSQRPQDESTPALLIIARSNKDPQLRKRAIFWLGQSKDPRALEYFESILTKR